MAKAKDIVPAIEKSKDTASFSFNSSDGMHKAMGDISVGDEVSVTVKGKVKSLSTSHHGKDFESSDFSIDISSISGKNKEQETSDEEMNDTMEE